LLGDADEEIVSRFLQEMRVVGQVSHPHVVHVYDAGPVGKTYFLAMEYVEGADLGQLARTSGRLPVARVQAYMEHAALGLQHLQERGLVHRDIKPSNLLVTQASGTQSGVLKILDLGLARMHLSAHARSTKSLTQFGDVMGT